jgi:hypothetical protein
MSNLIEDLVDDYVFQNILHESFENFQNTLFKKVKNFKIVLLEKEKFIENTFSRNFICFICLEKIVKNQIVYKLNCNHIFHAECLDQCVSYQHFQCPTCRKPFPVRNTDEHFIYYHDEVVTDETNPPSTGNETISDLAIDQHNIPNK